MTLVEMQVKWSVALTDRLGPEILTVLEIKGQVLHRVQKTFLAFRVLLNVRIDPNFPQKMVFFLFCIYSEKNFALRRKHF